jgi:DNA polymerase/3'-5' exonuclease PolX
MSVNPWRSEKIRRPRAAVAPSVAEIVQRLDGFEVYVCGSWRRGCSEIGDLDVLIVTPDGTLPGELNFVMCEIVELERGGPALANGNIELPDGHLHVDFYACSPAQRGAFMWFLTGPADLNITMRAAAMRRGWMLNQYGLWAGDNRLDDGTERSLGRLLGFERLLPPTDRQDWSQPKGPQIRAKQVVSSDGVTFYTVSAQGERVSCTCPGFRYRRKCRHIKALASAA